MKRSIEQDIRNKNFGIRNGNCEKNAVVKNQGTKQRVHRILGDCWQWATNGQCVKGDNCSFRHDLDKRGKVTPSNPSPNSFMQQSERNERKSSRTRSPRGRVPVVECLDGIARITSKELAKTHFVTSGTLQNACYILLTQYYCTSLSLACCCLHTSPLSNVFENHLRIGHRDWQIEKFTNAHMSHLFSTFHRLYFSAFCRNSSTLLCLVHLEPPQNSLHHSRSSPTLSSCISSSSARRHPRMLGPSQPRTARQHQAPFCRPDCP